jgi:hypothetical protein
MRLKWIFILLIAFGAYHYWHGRPVTIHMAFGVGVAEEPLQNAVGSIPEFQKGAYRIKALAEYDITGRVLGVEHYHLDREADLAPVDLAVGWGAMSDPEVLSKISFSQSSRFYYWHVDEFPIPRELIESHSANMHMIPSNENIADRLAAIRPGEIVKIHGYLVEATAEDGWRWRSSLSRSDTGAGACELVWVESVETY